MKITKTRNYENFNIMPNGNRFIKESHIKKMAHKITTLDLTMVCPIICYKKGGKTFILEGQHRFEACKRLKKPVYYVIVPKTTRLKEYILQLNSGNKKHDVEDRLKIQKDFGEPNARKVYNVWRTHNKIRLSTLASLLGSFGRGGHVSRSLERGTYKVKYLNEFKKMYKFLDSLPLANWKWGSEFVYFINETFKYNKGRQLAGILKEIRMHEWVKENNAAGYRQQLLDVQDIDIRRKVC